MNGRRAGPGHFRGRSRLRFRGPRGYAGPWLGQEPLMEVLPPEAAGGSPEDLTAGQAASFRTLWERFTSIWPAFLGLERELVDRAARWRLLALDRYRAGDVEGYRALLARVQNLERMEAGRKNVQGRVLQFKDAWEAIRSYIANAGRWLGVQGLGNGRLGLPPLLLVVGIPAALGALVYVINTHQRIRADLDADAQVLAAVEAGRITAEAGAALIGARQPKGLFAGLGGALTPVVLVGGGLLALLAFRGGGTRARAKKVPAEKVAPRPASREEIPDGRP